MTTKNDFNKKKILITGGAGFIGSSIALYLQDNYPESEIYVFDKFQGNELTANGNFLALGHFKNLIGFNGVVMQGDINIKSDMAGLMNIDWDCIFHQAAISDTTVTDQSLVMKTNLNTLSDLIDLALNSDAHLVYASSAGTYGNTEAPNKVGSGESPENVYGFSKLMMDRLASSRLKSNEKLKITGLRYFNVYGNREFYKGPTASMILQLGLQLLANGKVRLFEFGEQSRDFVYVDDVVQANILAVGKPSGVYNVGFGIQRTFLDIVTILSNELDILPQIEYIKNPYTFYQNNTCADIRSTQKLLGYRPDYSLEQGIKKYIPEILEIHNKKK